MLNLASAANAPRLSGADSSEAEVGVSELVHLECADGDPAAAARRATF
jgi:hypothetical protein